MTRVLVLVEGFTEEAFVKQVLAPYLRPMGVFLLCTVYKTKEVVDGPNHRGGGISFGKFRREVLILLNNSDAYVTTMIDFYALESGFPSRNEGLHLQPQSRVRLVEDGLIASIDNHRFKPYVMLHEFEAFIFVDPQIVQENFTEFVCEASLRLIKNQFPTPEEINDSPLTAPSKRLKQIFGPAYQKDYDGPLITAIIGVDRIREECPHFSDWLTWLEGLGSD